MSAGLFGPENMGFKVVADGEVFTFTFSIGILVEARAPGDWGGVKSVEKLKGCFPGVCICVAVGGQDNVEVAGVGVGRAGFVIFGVVGFEVLSAVENFLSFVALSAGV